MSVETTEAYCTRREREELVLAHFAAHPTVRNAHHALANKFQEKLEQLAGTERNAVVSSSPPTNRVAIGPVKATYQGALGEKYIAQERDAEVLGLRKVA